MFNEVVKALTGKLYSITLFLILTHQDKASNADLSTLATTDSRPTSGIIWPDGPAT